jgi:hypothetical protein
MKKLIVMAAVVLLGATAAKAQFKKGDVILGGNLNVTTESQKVKDADTKKNNTTFGVSPKVGVALNPNWVVGIFARTEFDFDKNLDGTKDKKYYITPGIFARNYHMLGESKFAFFAEANAGYNFGSEKYNDVKTTSYNGFSVRVLPGITYFVNKHFMLEGAFGGLNYTYLQEKAEATGVKTNTNHFSFDFPKEFQLGVNWIF